VKRRWPLILIIALTLASLPAWAQTPQEARQQLRQKLVGLLDHWEDISGTAVNLQKELDSLERLIASEQAEASGMKSREGELRLILEGMLAEEAPLKELEERQRLSFHRQLRTLYILGYEDGFSLLKSSSDFRLALQRSRAFALLLAAQQQRLADLRAASRRLLQVQEVLTKKSEQLLRLRAQAETSRQRLSTLRQQRLVLLARLEAKQKALIENIGALKEAEARLARAFALPVENGAQAERRLPGVLEARGQLSPPVEGRVLASYGQGRRGITIKARELSPVRAPWGGKVAYAGQLEGYGQVVVLDHGQAVHTVLAHLASILVRAGQQLSPGEQVGTVGADGRLYLEVRLKAKPVDPLKWLRLGS
jgi:murein hydrolase activator